VQEDDRRSHMGAIGVISRVYLRLVIKIRRSSEYSVTVSRRAMAPPRVIQQRIPISAAL
jgi:hypothetical protein